MILPRLTLILLVATTALSACSHRDKDVRLKKLRQTSAGPDEFSIVPTKPLEQPKDYSTLPPPTPGAGNLSDPDPEAQAVAALGGRPGASQGVSNNALLQHAERYGMDPGVRQRLAAEDLDLRRRHGNRNIIRIGPGDNYTDAYKKEWLDADAEAKRLRQLGIQTPDAPPAPK